MFTQYFLVFMVGVWFNKLKMYERVMRFRTGFIMVPLVVLFSLNLSNLFTFNNSIEILKYLFYSNGRSVIFSLSAVLLVLLFLRKFGIPRNRFVELIAKTSILIYFMEPFFSYILRNYVFGQSTIYFAAGLNFYLYIITRIVVLFLFLPLGVKAVKNYLINGILR